MTSQQPTEDLLTRAQILRTEAILNGRIPFAGITRNGEIVQVVPASDGWGVALNGIVFVVFETIEQANADADLYCPLADAG